MSKRRKFPTTPHDSDGMDGSLIWKDPITGKVAFVKTPTGRELYTDNSRIQGVWDMRDIHTDELVK